MITKKILEIKLKNKDIKDSTVRRSIGEFAGWVGIVLNLFMSVFKIIIGILISSISVMADGVNNAFDTAASVATIVGYRLSAKPADEEHPYGHGRIEYITGVIVSIFVIIIGVQFIKSSYDRIMNPSFVTFNYVSLGLLLLSIVLKLWFSHFNKVLGKKIESKALLATAYDSMGDVITTIVVIIPMVSGLFFSFQIDGYIGILVSLMIIFNGIKLLKETISPLIGNPPNKEVIESVRLCVLKNELVGNIHNIRYESYGGREALMTMDVELPGNITLNKAHKIIDKIEREVYLDFGIHLVIHMEPKQLLREDEIIVLEDFKRKIVNIDWVKSIHDFRIDINNDIANGYIDISVDGYRTELSEKEIKDILMDKLKLAKNMQWDIRIFRVF